MIFLRTTESSQFRNLGLTARLTDAALEYAKREGVAYPEAYPVDSDSPSYRFMGVRPMFEEKGFDYIGTAGTRRHVVCRKF